MDDVPAHRERLNEPRPGDKRVLRHGDRQPRHVKSAAETAAEGDRRDRTPEPAETAATDAAGDDQPAADDVRTETTGAGKRRSKEAR